MEVLHQNTTKKLPIEIEKYNTFFKRFRGLMLKKSLQVEKGIAITPCNSIHMFFMRFPIDVLFLDKRGKVLKIVPHLKPWRIVPPIKNAHTAIELPQGTAERFGVYEGNYVYY
ncbi:DUF192 domain-containing protein [Pseudalkalibacillus caeni]|uniref:DUF192 domain-containing protein n=1 Tax=Exobacillus caeni TaxID=2574798 RepID=A0A5R9EXI7_9BACL|nr:DUF192 domain-containing protein [Pseudalkalibacillus caeni]TLS35571.1 DUF192 domain-containing protein [Pseudalkalibacillus caeni]